MGLFRLNHLLHITSFNYNMCICYLSAAFTVLCSILQVFLHHITLSLLHFLSFSLLYQLNQFGRHRSQAIEMSEKFWKSQVTLGLSEWVPDMVTEGQKVEFPQSRPQYV